MIAYISNVIHKWHKSGSLLVQESSSSAREWFSLEWNTYIPIGYLCFIISYFSIGKIEISRQMTHTFIFQFLFYKKYIFFLVEKRMKKGRKLHFFYNFVPTCFTLAWLLILLACFGHTHKKCYKSDLEKYVWLICKPQFYKIWSAKRIFASCIPN